MVRPGGVSVGGVMSTIARAVTYGAVSRLASTRALVAPQDGPPQTTASALPSSSSRTSKLSPAPTLKGSASSVPRLRATTSSPPLALYHFSVPWQALFSCGEWSSTIDSPYSGWHPTLNTNATGLALRTQIGFGGSGFGGSGFLTGFGAGFLGFDFLCDFTECMETF